MAFEDHFQTAASSSPSAIESTTDDDAAPREGAGDGPPAEGAEDVDPRFLPFEIH